MKIFAGSSNPRVFKKMAIASDYAGFSLKKVIVRWLRKIGYQVTDFGCHSLELCDFPDYAKPVAKAISEGKFDRGILVCGTGAGMSIAANRFKNVRAVLCYTIKQAMLARIHNDANILCLGNRLISNKRALRIVDAFLKTKFEALPRRRRRVRKIDSGC